MPRRVRSGLKLTLVLPVSPLHRAQGSVLAPEESALAARSRVPGKGEARAPPEKQEQPVFFFSFACRSGAAWVAVTHTQGGLLSSASPFIIPRPMPSS